MSIPTEAECQATIVEAAHLGGWLVHHTRAAPSKKGWRTPLQGDAGFPDLVLAGHGHLIMVELKRKPNVLSDHQRRWLAVLEAAGIDARVAWMPDELDALVAELVNARQLEVDHSRHPAARRIGNR